MHHNDENRYVLAFDTSNEVIAIGVGELCARERAVRLIAHEEAAAHRASNTQLLPRIDALFQREGIAREGIACVCVGRGPGSFTGVRIAMATAKGASSALGVGLVGVSTQASIAWGAWEKGRRGRLLVASDAMRKEIYPAFFELSDAGVERLTPDRVVKAEAFAAEAGAFAGGCMVAGDALGKYADMLGRAGEVVPEDEWTPTGRGLLLALQALWRSGEADPLNASRHDPVGVLPVYTRLSDAEENERIRLADASERDLRTGVQGAHAPEDVQVRPFDAAFADAASAVERDAMGSDAWSTSMIADELPRRDRTWWMAVRDGELVGYAGGMLADGDMQLLKIAVVPAERRRGVARRLLERVAEDAENLAATTMSLEVRESNSGAQAFYAAAGFEREGVRPGYYSDGEAAVIMRATLPLRGRCAHGGGPVSNDDAAGGAASGVDAAACFARAADDAVSGAPENAPRPLIIAIESSCDETAASVIDGEGRILSSVVSSQIDFHARFGGVVPEIASRKHVEAIVGVTRLALADAARSLGCATLGWRDLDAVAVTYAPGLVGALVVGVAFAKGAAWAAGIKLVVVNHLEGHLYANKLADPPHAATNGADPPHGAGTPPHAAGPAFEPPAVVSLVSGGNTMLVHMRDWQDYEILGATIDDAVGEAFDKVAKALGLPYPGGPHISRLAEEGDPAAIDFPRALMHSGDYRFSLSGLKTAVATYINKQLESGAELNVPDVCASFQQAVIDVQVHKAAHALDETAAGVLCLGGGVAANPELRRAYERMCAKRGVRVVMPPLSACGDNAAMIALVALDRYRQGRFAGLDMDARAHADVSEAY